MPSSARPIHLTPSRSTTLARPHLLSAAIGSSLHVLTFHGNAETLFKVFITNVLKTVLTMGIYTFWAKVNLRRYLWSQVELAGDRFAYHGTAKELFMGWCKVMLVVALWWTLQVALQSPELVLVGALVTYGMVALLIPLAKLGTLRYRLSRTSWRGIRFSCRAQYGPFLWLSVRGLVLTILSFGLYYPSFHYQLTKHLFEHCYFGSIRFQFDGVVKPLRHLYFVAIATSVGSVVAFVAAAKFWPVLALPGIFGLMFLLAWSWIHFSTERRKYYLNHTSIAGGRVRCTIESDRLILLYAVNALVLVVTLGLGYAWVKVRLLRYFFSNLTLSGSLDLGSAVQSAQEARPASDELAGFLDVDALPT